MADDLTGLGTAGREAQPGDDVVEPASSSDIRASPVLPARRFGFRIVLAELALEDSVVALDLLLLAEADGILAGLAPAVLMHAGHPFAAVDGAFRRVAPRSFQEQFGSFAAAEPANRSSITSHG